MSFTERTEALLGGEAVEALARARVLVVGVGGVGSYAAEALVRAGVGALTVVDGDVVAESNLNRQLIALRSELGRPKTEAAARRYLDINPDLRLRALCTLCSAETVEKILDPRPDYILDCIDSVTCKADLIRAAKAHGVPILSALGTGNRTDPFALVRTTLDKTSGCPLARALRHELRGSGCEATPVIFSREAPRRAVPTAAGERTPPASCAWVPSCAGLMMAAVCADDLIKGRKA